MALTHCRWTGIPFAPPEPCTPPRDAPTKFFYFDPGPPSNPRRSNFYGHFRRGPAVRRFHMNRAHEAALIEDAEHSRRREIELDLQVDRKRDQWVDEGGES